jgi:hypothetical protein
MLKRVDARWLMGVGGAVTAVAIAVVALTVKDGGATAGPTCGARAAAGTSSAAVKIPAHPKPRRYVVVVTADQTPDAPHPQTASLRGQLAGSLSATMNPAAYSVNNLPAGGAIQMWDTNTPLPASTAASILTATATNAGATVRLSVWICTR